MTPTDSREFASDTELLYFHFDVQEHFIKLDTFIKTSESAQKVVQALDATFFGGKLDYKLIVVPPEGGTFLSKLALWVVGGAGLVFTFINTDVGVAFIEGLTGKPPIHWAEEAGEEAKKLILDAGEAIEDLMEGKEENSEERSRQEVFCRLAAKITLQIARAILENPPEVIDKLGMEIGDLYSALEARSDFYMACMDDEDVRRIGFTPDDDFPIPRNSFAERARRPQRKETDDPAPEWHLATEVVGVTSPNWDEGDQRTRHWKGKNQTGNDCLFVIEDQGFWRLVRQKALRAAIVDQLRVQWAYQIVDGRSKNRRVLRVIEFNGERLADPLSEDALLEILGSFSVIEASRDELPLFKGN